jgi:hypothetical protein
MRTIRLATIIAYAAFVLSGCSGGGANDTPIATARLPAAPVARNDAAAPYIGGAYKGTVRDSKLGKGMADVALAQFGNAAGGSIVFAFDKIAVTSSVAVAVAANDSLRGTNVTTDTKVICSFALTGKYDAATHQLSGTYGAARHCSGESGTYTLKEKCFFQRGSDVRREADGLKPC